MVLLGVTTSVLFWRHGYRAFERPTYAEFAFCCISLPCPMVSHGAPAPPVELLPRCRWRASMWRVEDGHHCFFTRHVDATRLPPQSRHLPSNKEILNIQRSTCDYRLITSRNHVNLWQLLWSNWLAHSEIILCFLLPLDPAPFCYRSLFLSLIKPRVASMLPIGLWSSGTAWVGSDVCARTRAVPNKHFCTGRKHTNIHACMANQPSNSATCSTVRVHHIHWVSTMFKMHIM